MRSSYDNGCDAIKRRFENYNRVTTSKSGGNDSHYIQDANEYMEMDRDFSSRYFRKELEPDDKQRSGSHTEIMNDITREELSSTLIAIEDRMDRRIDRMERESERRSGEYRQELALRDEQIRRELDLRQESFRAEQLARDAALSEKFSGFLAAQAERDKALEKIADSRFERIEKDVTSIKADTKKVGEDVNGIKVTMGKYLGGAIVIGAIASALLGVALKYAFTLAG